MSETARPTTLGFEAVLFDMDGVVTRTASLHAAAWKELFDDFLRERAAKAHAPFRPFDREADYLAYVDGKPRHEGVRSFLAARRIDLPEGSSDDGPEALTVHGLGGRKDALFQRRLRRGGVEVFASTIDLIHALHERGVKTGVVTSSRNGREVLAAAGISCETSIRTKRICERAARRGAMLRSNHVTVPVLAGPGRMPKMPIVTNGSEHSLHAVEHAIRAVREALGAKAVPLNAGPSLVDWQTHRIAQDAILAHLRQRGAVGCEAARELLETAGVPCRVVV